MLAALTAYVLGFVGGLRHALEPDHLAAVSTLVAGQKSTRTTVRYAAAWGAGHAVMLIAVGGTLALFRTELPKFASDMFELVVAMALVALGIRGFFQVGQISALSAKVAHRHAGDDDYAHVHGARQLESGRDRLPFAIGLIHGLAGSGAAAALVAARTPSAAFALTFIAVFAVGAAAGMSALAGLLGWPLARAMRSTRALPVLVGLSASVSLGIGLWWAWTNIAHLVA
ncbi:MAG: hypothetical protein FWD73_03350 [Polyangiaceae bacterium]|nr:hypothetical protein [Polyangiaceae bacterium]